MRHERDWAGTDYQRPKVAVRRMEVHAVVLRRVDQMLKVPLPTRVALRVACPSAATTVNTYTLTVNGRMKHTSFFSFSNSFLSS